MFIFVCIVVDEFNMQRLRVAISKRGFSPMIPVVVYMRSFAKWNFPFRDDK